jgi:hypothetical protein
MNHEEREEREERKSFFLFAISVPFVVHNVLRVGDA